MLQLGALVSEDPEEEKRQKDFKSFLNKLTLDNYDTIKDKIVAVGIVSEATLIGLIDQVRLRTALPGSFHTLQTQTQDQLCWISQK